ncbi:MAG: hypothetical protein ACTSYC_08495 [Promethearchaeota archaeon]
MLEQERLSELGAVALWAMELRNDIIRHRLKKESREREGWEGKERRAERSNKNAR